MKRRADYVVVGAGSAGCVLANRLSEGLDEVALLEAGQSDLTPFIQLPVGLLGLPDRYNWRWQAEPDPSRNGLVQQWSGGRVLGGSSSINGQIWTRGNAGDYDEWAKAGASGWDWQTVLPYFRRAEETTIGDSSFRGRTGPMRVELPRFSHPITDAFMIAAEQAGHTLNSDYNGASQMGVGLVQLSQRRGLRHSTARAYLSPARRRPNLHLLTGATAVRVLIEHGRAVGVEFLRKDGALDRYFASKEVILCGGAFASPRLLMSSGIGPADPLRQLGIVVEADSPEVGENLQDHPYLAMNWRTSVPTLNDEFRLVRYPRHALEFLALGKGPVTATVAHALVFGRVDGGDRASEYEMAFAPFGLESAAGGHGASSGLGKSRVRPMGESSVRCAVSISHPRGRGTVRLNSADPLDPPTIAHQLLGDQRDARLLVEVGKAARDIFASIGIRSCLSQEVSPGDPVRSDDDWFEYLRQNAIIGQHPVGTCRAGDDDRSVVDPELKVRGVNALRVVDASIMPTLITGNTNAPTIMIAERAADLIKTHPHSRLAPPR